MPYYNVTATAPLELGEQPTPTGSQYALGLTVRKYHVYLVDASSPREAVSWTAREFGAVGADIQVREWCIANAPDHKFRSYQSANGSIDVEPY